MPEEIVKPEVIDCGQFDGVTPATPKRDRGGRPKLSPPADAAACRALIAQEVIRHKPRELMLRGLFRLLNEYKQHEKSPLEVRKIEALEQVNRDKAAEIELKRQALAMKRADYRLRFVQRSLGQQKLLKNLERVEAENAELKGLLGRVA